MFTPEICTEYWVGLEYDIILPKESWEWIQEEVAVNQVWEKLDRVNRAVEWALENRDCPLHIAWNEQLVPRRMTNVLRDANQEFDKTPKARMTESRGQTLCPMFLGFSPPLSFSISLYKGYYLSAPLNSCPEFLYSQEQVSPIQRISWSAEIPKPPRQWHILIDKNTTNSLSETVSTKCARIPSVIPNIHINFSVSLLYCLVPPGAIFKIHSLLAVASFSYTGFSLTEIW